MLKRIITAVVALPFFLFVLFFLPPFATAIMASLLALIGTFELLYQTRIVTSKWVVGLSMILSAALPQGIFYHVPYEILLFIYFVYIALLFVYAMGHMGHFDFSRIAISLFGALVIPLFFSAFPVILAAEKGKYLIVLPFLYAWGSDTFAYFAGRAFGKHKLIPLVSPKKTVEGSVGGVIGTLILTAGYCILLRYAFHLQPHYLLIILTGLISSVISMIGDLSMSLIKRENQIKDYGKLMPGHGGILDRFDSVLFVLPVVFTVVSLFPLV